MVHEYFQRRMSSFSRRETNVGGSISSFFEELDLPMYPEYTAEEIELYLPTPLLEEEDVGEDWLFMGFNGYERKSFNKFNVWHRT